MPPPVSTFLAPALPLETHVAPGQKYRKGYDGQLKRCELFEMLQYRCEVEEPRRQESVVRCWPVVRLMRRCQDRNGSFMVETTSWEGDTEEKARRGG